MLVLSRKCGEQILVNGNVTVTVIEITKSQIRLGIEAPAEVRILRSELAARDGRTVQDGDGRTPRERVAIVDIPLAGEDAEHLLLEGVV
jgi:carbon storage regulator CsrA